MIIKTPSRLHLSLIDLNGALGRIDGGVGITIEEPRLVLRAEQIDSGIEINFTDSKNLDDNLMQDYTQKIQNSAINTINYFELDHGFSFSVEKTYPAHSGLGSGTQLSMATAKIIAALNGIKINSTQLGQIVGRGGTSGIGVAAFQKGGFIVDGGHNIKEKSGFLPSSASSASPPPIIARYDFPEDWNIILAIPQVNNQVSGKKEVNIFQEYCPISRRDVEKLSHLLLMKMMPAVLEHDIDSFGEAVNQIQNIGFKKIELDLQHHLLNDIIMNMREAGACGAGMSSFGPTIYAVTDNNSKDVLKAAQDTMGGFEATSLITRAQNSGALIKDIDR